MRPSGRVRLCSISEVRLLSLDVWRKIREDGSTGLAAVLAGVSAAVRGAHAVPELLRLRWRLRDTRAELASAYADLGRLLAPRLTADATVDPSDEQAKRCCRRIELLLAEERRVRDELMRWQES